MRYLPVFVLNGVLLGVIALAVVGVQLSSRAETSVEVSARAYASAVTNSDLDTALAQIAPDQRARWSDFVQSQLGNVYEVRGIAVRAPSLLQRGSAHVPGGPIEVTVILDVNRPFPQDFFQPTARVPVETFDGHPYLGAPPLAPQD